MNGEQLGVYDGDPPTHRGRAYHYIEVGHDTAHMLDDGMHLTRHAPVNDKESSMIPGPPLEASFHTIHHLPLTYWIH